MANLVRDRIVELRRVPAAELRANPKNWRRHPAAQGRALRSVLEQVGYADALLVRETPDGLELIDGHLRAETTPDQQVPVLVLDVDEAEADLILATLDPLAAMAETDQAVLAALLESVSITDADLADAMGQLAGTAERKQGLTDPDEVPDAPAKPKTKMGDLYLLGEHRLLCGDASDPADVAQLLDGGTFSLVATDPPYGVDYSGVVAGRKNQKRGGWRDIENDEVSEHGAELTGQALKVARPYAAKGCAVLVWHPSGENAAAFREALVAAGVHILKQIIWVKPTLVFGRHEYHWRHENAMYGWFEGSRARFFGERSETTVWEVSPPPSSKVRNGPAMATGGLGEHPTQKPVELTARPIRNHTKLGEVVYDPFLGAGSALIAADETSRRCYGMDIDPAYVDVAVKRWEAFTGKKAERVRG